MTAETIAVAATGYVTERKPSRRASMYRKAASAAGWLEKNLTDLAHRHETLDAAASGVDTSGDQGGVFVGMPVVEPAPSPTEAMNAWVSLYR